MPQAYTPPKIWSPKENGGAFASINRHTAGARTQQRLPIGQHPLQLYSMGTPNGVKVTILLEELLEAGIKNADYDAWFIDIREGAQFGSDFVEINPNSKIPALVDQSGANKIRVFESGSILLYLAEKFRRFISTEPGPRAETLNWLFWQMGSAPYLGGGFGHFFAYAPEKLEYPIDRFAMETKRQLDVLNQRFAQSEYVAGPDYTIADMAIYPWYGALVEGQLYNAAEFLSVHEYSHILRWSKLVGSRPAVQRGQRVNKVWGPESLQLRERHSSADFQSGESK